MPSLLLWEGKNVRKYIRDVEEKIFKNLNFFCIFFQAKANWLFFKAQNEVLIIWFAKFLWYAFYI